MRQTDRLPPYSHVVKPAELPGQTGYELSLHPDAVACGDIARALGLLDLRKLRFEGRLDPLGRRDWRLTARLGATVKQACVVTLAPVSTRIDEDVARIWRAGMATPKTDPAGEVEMPAETDEEPLTAEIDLGAVMVEALALALPPYPHAPEARLEQSAFTEPGQTPMTDEDARPFAGLAGLRDRLGEGEDE